MPARCSTFVTNLRAASKSRNLRYTSASHRMPMKKAHLNPYEVPNYTIEESARYLHADPQKVSYWIFGNEDMPPLTTVYTRGPILLSFKNLVECFVLESLRKIHGVSLQSIRQSIRELRIISSSKFPLADHELHTEDGRLIYLDDSGQKLICLTRGRQLVFRDIVMPFLKRVERNEKGIAKRLFPFTRREHLKAPTLAPKYVVIDPNVAFGMPVLVESRISTAFLLSRKRGGASVSELAADYGRPTAEIEDAIRLEQAT
jgi:uncharacterized protein (DUF433 family)